MAAIKASTFLCSSSSSSSSSSSFSRQATRASIHFPKVKTDVSLNTHIPKTQSTIGLVEEMTQFSRITPKNPNLENPKVMVSEPEPEPSQVMEKLYVVLEAVSDRVEMHKNIGEQRSNWNSLLLTSINTITLSAATMAAIAGVVSTSSPGAPFLGLKLSSTFMYLAATGMLVIMNKIQPSQLAEEQRNASRLFKKLESEIKTKMARGNPSLSDVHEAMEKVLAIDRAYPLPLLGVMLEKFPKNVEPAVWWPERRRTGSGSVSGLGLGSGLGSGSGKSERNGWSMELEEEMKEVIRVLEVKDKADYLRLGEKALKLSKGLAVAGPILTGLGAVGSAFLGHGSWAMVVGTMAGAMASVVNSVEHGGQVGMVVEMYRSNAGFFKMMQETIESSLKERDENGEVFEMKVALQLGRSLSELRDVAASSSRLGRDIQEFGSKLF